MTALTIDFSKLGDAELAALKKQITDAAKERKIVAPKKAIYRCPESGVEVVAPEGTKLICLDKQSNRMTAKPMDFVSLVTRKKRKPAEETANGNGNSNGHMELDPTGSLEAMDETEEELKTDEDETDEDETDEDETDEDETDF